MKKRMLFISGGLIAIAFLLEGIFLLDYFQKDNGQVVYQIVSTVEQGQKIKLTDVISATIKSNASEGIRYSNGSVIGKVAQKSYVPGDILVERDFQSTSQANASMSMVITLTQEDAHLYEMTPGESVEALILTNGQVELLDHITLDKISFPNPQSGNSIVASGFMTISANPEILKKLYGAVLNGNLRIIKK